MNKVFVLPAKEDWIVDRFVSEWTSGNDDVTVSDPRAADVIWLLASWCWRHLPKAFLSTKKVLVTIHHIVPEKFDDKKRIEFIERDELTTAYHVYNQKTYDFIRPLTSKPIHILPYWANQNIWKKTDEKPVLRKKYSLPENAYIVGSFQRDTEGHDLRTPKLEKGPDLFIDFVKMLVEKLSTWPHGMGRSELHVLLAGWRREYVRTRLDELRIPYTYFDRPSQAVVNDLYQTLDLYPVTSRCEGGPQSLIECGLVGIPMVTRDVGIASQLLPPEAISDDVISATPSIPNVESMCLPRGFSPYRELIKSL